MRFVNTTSLTFEDVTESQLRKLKGGYSILSHRWMEDEVQYTDMLDPGKTLEARGGYAKLKGSCALAKRLGFDLIWIDTCCINKADSVELGEAINSMYRWYSNAKKCIAYLEDVVATRGAISQISQSAWFSRGWTLQELIAPKVVSFYDRSWTHLGDKASLSKLLAGITGIPVDVLTNKRAPQTCSIAQRMTWAARRVTTRLEDRAYSLMGIFDVNMPMIYGERERAFIRLQEEIILKSTDESIFAWHLDLLDPSDSNATRRFSGLLAPSPGCFAKSGNFSSTGRSRGFRTDQFGLSVSMPAVMHGLDRFTATLKVTDQNARGNYAISLARLPRSNAYARISDIKGDSLHIVEPGMKTVKECSVAMNPMEAPQDLFSGFWLRGLNFYGGQVLGYDVLSRGKTVEADRISMPQGEVGTAGIVRLKLKNHGDSNGVGWIKFGFDPSCTPVCFMTFPPNDASQAEIQQFSTDFEQAKAAPLDSPERLNHPIFRDDWLLVTDREMLRYPPYSYDSRKLSIDPGMDLEFDFKAPAFNISVSIRKQPDVSPRNVKSSSWLDRFIWTVDIQAGQRPQQQNNSNGCCC